MVDQHLQKKGTHQFSPEEAGMWKWAAHNWIQTLMQPCFIHAHVYRLILQKSMNFIQDLLICGIYFDI
ncbi:hypothetical protein T4E_3894 [Trichinella pseudospiralis]|uniref:Uncharacterized protein n=1 Tax=Trichinella pseudospiralis TaxID=6337 RepID=A0A0V0XKC7_TRIPS|nr:hypothetical protein T4E_3894 [Trichinella pseudospiralis]